MHRITAWCALAALLTLAACGGGEGFPGDDPPTTPAPASVSCADAPRLTQRALDDRRRSDALRSDQERIYVGNRASYFAALAIIADLECRTASVATDEALGSAFEAAREAENSNSMYERAFKWGRAHFLATQVIARLVQELPDRPG